MCSLLRYRSRCYLITNLSQITWPWSVSGCLTGLERYCSLKRLQLISYRILSHHQPVCFPFRRDLHFSSTLAIYCAPVCIFWEESQHRQRFIGLGKAICLMSPCGLKNAIEVLFSILLHTGSCCGLSGVKVLWEFSTSNSMPHML